MHHVRLALSASLLLGCAAAHTGSTVPRPAHAVRDVSVHACLPSDVDQLLFADLASMRRAGLYPALAESFDAWGPSLERIGAGGEPPAPGPSVSDVIGRTEWALFALAGEDGLLF